MRILKRILLCATVLMACLLSPLIILTFGISWIITGEGTDFIPDFVGDYLNWIESHKDE